MPRVNLYIKDELDAQWKRFKSATKRDGTSPSAIFQKAMQDWLVIHEPGNPQTRITSFSPDGQTTLAAIEGRIRQVFLKNGRDETTWRSILEEVRDDRYKIPRSSQLPMAERVKQWLIEKGVKVWN